MTGLVIKELPAGLHRKLKQRAARHRRSMTKEVLAVLERAVGEEARPQAAPAPFKGRVALTDGFIARARRQGRA
jgi:plasmid stability protein